MAEIETYIKGIYMRRYRKIFGMALSTMMVASLSGCLVASETKLPELAVSAQVETKSYVTGQILQGDVKREKILHASNKATSTMNVTAKTDGEIVEKRVKVGDVVKKGDVLAIIDDTNLQKTKESLLSSKAELEQSLTFLQEQQKCKESIASEKQADGLITADEYKKSCEQIKREYQGNIGYLQRMIASLTKNIEEVEKNIKNCKVTSSVNGMVHMVTSLEIVSSGDVLFSIGDTNTGEFSSSDVSLAAYLQKNQVYSFETNTGTQYDLTYLGPNETEEKLMFRLDKEQDLNGLVVTLSHTIVIEEKKDVLCVENQFVHSVDGAGFVYVPDEIGLKEIVQVEFGLKGDQTTEILSVSDKEGPLNEGDTVFQ